MEKIFGDKKAILVLVLPAFIIYIIFVLIPIGYNIYISLFRTNLMSPGIFVGFTNYKNLFQDATFIKALKNNLFMVVGSLIAHLPLALFFANMLFQKIKGGNFFQNVFFLPCVISGVAVGLMWTFVYHSEFGLLNKFLELMGHGDLKQVWLANKDTAMFCIIVVVMWMYVGYHMVIQIAAMKSIPESLYEAAWIDGANAWKRFTCVTFPLIKHILKIDAVLIITGSLKYYDLVAIMTGGGPNHATELMSTYMYYQGFRTLKYGYSAAIGVILFLLCIAAVVIANLLFRSEQIEY